MKSAIFAGVSAGVLLFAGSALATGNQATIDQIGTTQTATIDQTASSSDAVATVTQSDGYNLANVTQGGSGNQASVTQSQGSFGVQRNPSNVSNSNQQGVNGGATVVQVGNNTSTINQAAGSVGEHALVGQSNNGNTSNIGQSGQNEFAVANQQDGTGNSATIAQSGTGDGETGPVAVAVAGPGSNLHWHENVPSTSVLPSAGSGLTLYGPIGAAIDQVGTNNAASIDQGGFQNFADIAQGDVDAVNSSNNSGTIVQGGGVFQSDAVMFQHGHFNVASISQVGAGSTYSTVWQNGDSNQAYSSQTGSNHSVIEQGFSDEGVYAAGTANNEYASVNQAGGGGNTSLVRQLGSNDTANVTQFGANATATIHQAAGGSFNVATIHQ